MKNAYRFILAGALLSSAFYAMAQMRSEKPTGSSLQCQVLHNIENNFLAFHVAQPTRSPELATRVVDQYLKHLDPIKVYLQEEDVQKIRGMMSNVFDRIKSRDCGFLIDAQKIVVQRMMDRVGFVKTFLGSNYKFDEKVEFIFDAEKKPWPKNQQEANAFMEKYLHFQISNYLATDMKLEEAKSRVIKLYERVLKKAQDESTDDIYAGYLDSFGHSLDPHSTYFSKDAFDDFSIQMGLNLEGIGATLSSEDGFTKIEALVPGGPAARSGQVEPQDLIVAVGQATGPMENVIDMELSDVVKKIRGPKGTTVRLAILRKVDGKKTRFDINLVRDKINLEDDAAQVTVVDKTLNGKKVKLGILNLPSFYSDSKRGGRSCSEDMKKVIKEAKSKHIDGMVLDLSQNGGGSLDDAVKIAGLFFKTGNVVKQSTRPEIGATQTLADIDPEVQWNGPLVVLTSRISASASEIVSGTLQDYNRAVIVGGGHTFGKGSVQTVQPLPYLGGGAMKITIGMFFIPGGKSTQHGGVDSDVIIPDRFSSDDVGEKFLDYSLPPKKLESFVSQDAFVKDGNQAWTPVKPEWMKVLQSQSQARVEKSDEFKKIVEELKKSKERGKLIRVSELMKDGKDTKAKKDKEKKNRYAKKEERTKEYLKRPDVQEAANVLLDLMKLESASKSATHAMKGN